MTWTRQHFERRLHELLQRATRVYLRVEMEAPFARRQKEAGDRWVAARMALEHAIHASEKGLELVRFMEEAGVEVLPDDELVRAAIARTEEIEREVAANDRGGPILRPRRGAPGKPSLRLGRRR